VISEIFIFIFVVFTKKAGLNIYHNNELATMSGLWWSMLECGLSLIFVCLPALHLKRAYQTVSKALQSLLRSKRKGGNARPTILDDGNARQSPSSTTAFLKLDDRNKIEGSGMYALADLESGLHRK